MMVMAFLGSVSPKSSSRLSFIALSWEGGNLEKVLYIALLIMVICIKRKEIGPKGTQPWAPVNK